MEVPIVRKPLPCVGVEQINLPEESFEIVRRGFVPDTAVVDRLEERGPPLPLICRNLPGDIPRNPSGVVEMDVGMLNSSNLCDRGLWNPEITESGEDRFARCFLRDLRPSTVPSRRLIVLETYLGHLGRKKMQLRGSGPGLLDDLPHVGRQAILGDLQLE